LKQKPPEEARRIIPSPFAGFGIRVDRTSDRTQQRDLDDLQALFEKGPVSHRAGYRS
jgi:hypothetical protein